MSETTPFSSAPVKRAPATSPLLVLVVSVLGISLAAPLVRLSDSSALVIASWRLGFSLIIIFAVLAIGGGWRAWRTMSRRDLALTGAAGVFLAIHFWSWNQSLRFTSVAASVSLVNTQPVIIAAFSAFWLREPPSRRQWSGIALAVFGALVVGLADVPGGPAGIIQALTSGAPPADGSAEAAADGARSRALLGDLLALVGAIAGAFYFLIGRRVRQTMALWPYVGLVYSAAFVVCVALAAASGEQLYPHPPREYAIFAGLALGPMLLGHTGMNWALGHLPAFVVNLTTLGEPIGATLLAALIPGIGEVPGVGTVIGGALVLTGVIRAARR